MNERQLLIAKLQVVGWMLVAVACVYLIVTAPT